MAVLADDDVVVHGEAEWGGDIDDRLGHLDVGLRRRRIAAKSRPSITCDMLRKVFRVFTDAPQK